MSVSPAEISRGSPECLFSIRFTFLVWIDITHIQIVYNFHFHHLCQSRPHLESKTIVEASVGILFKRDVLDARPELHIIRCSPQHRSRPLWRDTMSRLQKSRQNHNGPPRQAILMLLFWCWDSTALDFTLSFSTPRVEHITISQLHPIQGL